MKNKIINKNLIAEGMAQLKLPGFVLLIVSFLGAVIPAAFKWINFIQSQNTVDASYTYPNNTAIDALSTVPILLPIMYIAPFILCKLLFSFLNNRKGSDFYHSLAISRASLYINFTLSIIIWLIIIIAVPTLAASLIYIISPVNFNIALIPYVLLCYLAGSFLVTSCILIAMSITGTAFSNFILFGLVLLLPQFIIFTFTKCIFQLVPVISSTMGGPAIANYNIPVNFLLSFFGAGYYGLSSVFTSKPAIIYTFILATVYFVLACWLFKIRKSETAGSSAPNRALQNIYRCAITLPAALFVPITITSYSQKSFLQALGDNVYAVTIITLISIAIYFLFELFTTKSVKSMLKSAPVFLVVIGLCFIFGFSEHVVQNHVLNFKPSSSEIDSVSIMHEDNSYSQDSVSYNDLVTKNIKFKDYAVKNAVAETLADNISAINSGSTLKDENTATYYVVINLKNSKTAKRAIYASNYMSKEIRSAINLNSEYKNISLSLPPQSSINEYRTNYIFNNASCKKLWETYIAEFNSLSDKEKQSVIYSNFENINADNFTISGSINLEKYQSIYFITSLTPKTEAMYIDMFNKQNKAKAESLINSAGNFVNSDTFSCDITVYDTVKDSGDIVAHFDNSSSKNSLKLLNTVLSRFNDTLDVTKPYMRVNLSYDNEYCCYYQAISEDSVKALTDNESNSVIK